MAEPDRLQPGKPVAAAGAAEEDRELVADQLAAAAGEDGRAVGETCALLLASVGRGPSDAPSFRGDFAEDLGVTVAGGVAIDSWREVGEERAARERCLVNEPESRQVRGFGTRKGQDEPSSK